ncbi:MAG: antitoxin Xre-like helix-turn-helix domain-containing protein [Casimicrobium sp.]
MKRVRKGYPASAVKDLAALLGASEAQVAAALRIARKAFSRRHSDEHSLKRAASDPVYRAFRIVELTLATLGDWVAARGWLFCEHAAFGGTTALSMMHTTAGYDLVQQGLMSVASLFAT